MILQAYSKTLITVQARLSFNYRQVSARVNRCWRCSNYINLETMQDNLAFNTIQKQTWNELIIKNEIWSVKD